MKVITQVALCVSFSWTAVFAQSMDRPKLAASSEDHSSRSYKVNWRVDPFDQKSFIENLGQFDTVLTNTTKVWYGAALGDVTAYFTSNGLVYRYDQPLDQKAAGEKENEDADKINLRKCKTHYLKIEWEGSNPYAKIDASEKRPDYYVYPTGLTSSLQASLFKKITYRDLYPGIDVEYIFPEGKEGLKYAIIAHPGSDISKVKLKYIGAKSISKNKEGDVVIRTEMGDFTDHAPVSFYDGESKNEIHSVNNLQGSIESFSVPNPFDRNKTLVIDPWVTNPFGYGGKRGPWDIDYDYSGNVYAASGGRLVKFNSSGTIVWTYTISGITYCDFTVDRVTGTSYVVGLGGYTGVIQKISTTGGLVATASTANNKAWEFWRAVWNPCTNQIVIGAGGTNGDGSTGTNTNQGAITDLNLSAITIRNVMGVAGSNYDMVGVAVDPSGTSCYMANVNWSVANNKLIKLPLPAFTPTIFNVANGYLFQETSHNFYAGGLGGWYHGMNVMTAGNNGVYMWDGYTLKQFNKITGALITSNVVQPPYVISGIVKSFWAGIDVDVCEKIYAGYKTSVKVFNSS
ncbi:MAG: hypothetical protein JNL63_05175, partial [Bacteroidia bacterium]|nr:hypothetical protein [Bacteroidia bacterium]